jgi:hypothetical protein
MGRQIIFHMLPEDRSNFLGFVQQRDRVVVTGFTSNTADVQPIDFEEPQRRRDWLCLWNLDLLPSLERRHVPVSDIGPYYRVDDSLPILEFSTSIQVQWDQRPALVQGRLYGNAYQDHSPLKTWYEALARWLRKNFVKNPIGWMSGYVGPAAYQWYERGGLLLPTYNPPLTEEWRDTINEQHPIS